MIKNYLKIAWRNLKRNPTFSLINISGLTVGIAACLLIFLYIQDELSYDRFHKKAERLFRVVQSTPLSGTAVIPAYGASQMGDFAEIAKVVRVYHSDEIILLDGRKPIREQNIYYADSTFFEVFTFPLKRGDAGLVLSEPNSVVLTPHTAERYFGGRNPMGKTLTLRGGRILQVTGVTEEIPPNSHLQFDMLISFSTLDDPRGFDYQGFTYLLLTNAGTEASLEAKLAAITNSSSDEILQHFGYVIKDMRFALQPITDIHLYPAMNGRVQAQSDVRYIYIFGVVGLFILLIACINYMNLSTARSAGRNREVGLRKVVGAGRFQLIGQFLGESILVTAIAFLLGIGLADLLLPVFNNLTGKELTLQALFSMSAAGYLIITILLVGGISGLYPAFVLSGYSPTRILRSGGNAPAETGSRGLRRGLVAFQFVICIVLISSTLVIKRQLNYIQDKWPGYDTEQILTLPVPEKPENNSSIAQETELTRQRTIKQELAAVPGVQQVSLTLGPPTSYLTSDITYKEQEIKITQLPVDYAYLSTMGMNLIAGRGFSKEHATDAARGIIINETAARVFNLEDKVGEPLDIGLGHQKPILIGIVEDFHTATLHYEIRPTVLVIRPYFYNNYVLRLAPGSLPGVLDRLKSTWEEFEFAYPFEYWFLDERVQKLYTSEQRLSWMFQGFAILAIVIACLGLLGLAAYTAQRRTKEIGIRKVLGATITNIVGLLSKDFLKLVAIGFVIAVPIAWYAMNKWLADFAYRIDIGIDIFLLAGGLALFIALATISWQSIRAALANPVDSLRSE